MNFLGVGRWGHLLVLLAVVLPQSGCENGNGGDGDAMVADGTTMPAAVLEVVGDQDLALLFGEEAVVRIVYREMDGSPIPDSTVELALVGRANDSSLSELGVRTDADGEAGFRVMAGTTASAFSVRVSAPRAAPILIGVSVSDAGFGGLFVDVEWMGMRRVDSRRVAVFTGMTCDDVDVLEGEADREKTLLETEERAAFLALPAGLVYAVTATGQGPMGDALARGCIDDVAIEADLDTETLIVMEDLPLRTMGSYSTLLDVDAATSAEALSRAVTRGGRSLVEAAGGDASFLLDRIEAHLRDAGDASGADAIASARSSSFLDDALGASLVSDDVGPTRAVDALADELAERAARIEIEGSVVLDETDSGFDVTSIVTRDVTSTMPALRVDLVDLGPALAGRLTYTPLPEEDAIAIDEIGATLPQGALGLGLADALVTEDGATDLGALLEVRGGVWLAVCVDRHRAHDRLRL